MCIASNGDCEPAAHSGRSVIEVKLNMNSRALYEKLWRFYVWERPSIWISAYFGFQINLNAVMGSVFISLEVRVHDTFVVHFATLSASKLHDIEQ
jgi:hypothetical protein